MIAKFSVKKAYTVFVAVVMIIVLGVVAFTRMTTDLLPSINLPYVIVITSYPGASPEMVEMVVSSPLESSMATVSNIENITSTSSENMSMVMLEFSQSADMDSVSLEIRENIDQIKTYWNDDISSPIIMKLNPDMLPVMVAAFGIEGMNQSEVSDYALNNIEPEIESLEGVASASLAGLLDEKVHVVIRQSKIDEVNEKIFASIDKGIDEAKQELTDSKIELEDALAEAKKGYTAINDRHKEISANLAALAAVGQSESPAAAELNAAKAQLDASKRQLDTTIAKLNEGLDQIIAGEEEIEEGRTQAHEGANMDEVITADMVSQILSAQNFSMPAGYVTEKGIDYLVRVGDKPADIDAFSKLPIMDLGMEDLSTITLSDVAEVMYTDNSSQIYTNINGNSGVMLSIQKQTGYSTGDVSDKLVEKFKELEEDTEGLSFVVLNDQGVYIDFVMESIFNNLIWGALLAILILLLFLRDVKPTLIIALSIPISLITAIVCMYFTGVTLNVISLAGLALGIGMLVDNSIVVIENIYRLRNEGYSKIESAIKGTKEVGGAIIASTLTTISVFVPIIFVEGITRQLFVDMGLTIAFSLLASLLVALTVVPALSSKMLTTIKKDKKENSFAKRLLSGYEKFMIIVLKWKVAVFILVIAALVGSIVLAVSNGISFMDDMDSNQFTINITTPDGSTLEDTAKVTDEVVEIASEIEDIADVGAMSAASTAAMIGVGGGSSNTSTTIYLTTIDGKKRTNVEIGKEIEEKVAHIENATISISTSSMDMTALSGSGVSVMIKGREIDKLQEIANDVAKIIGKLEGTKDVSNGQEEATEELRVIVDRNKAIEHNITVAQVFGQIAPELADVKASTQLVTTSKDFDVYVMDEEDITITRDEIKKLTLEVTNKEGNVEEIPLSEIATFTAKEGLSSIKRDNQSRFIQVTSGVAEGYNIGFVAAEIEEALADYEVPSGYSLTFAGENEMIMESFKQMLLMLILAMVFMYCIMVSQFQSLLAPFIIMFTLPLAFTGGFFGLYISGSEISVIALVGFVMLAGVIVNNGIVIVDYMNQLQEEGKSKREAILTACKVRIRPVFMTALTTILALTTMVFNTDMGSEMSKPMAIVTIGGLIYGTLLTLIVIPCIYDVMYRKKFNTNKTETA